MIDDEREQVQAFEVDVSQNVDYVVIYTNSQPGDPPFEAVPFYHRDEDWYDEPLDFEVTNEYRHAVARNADMPLHLDTPLQMIKLERGTATHGYEEVPHGST